MTNFTNENHLHVTEPRWFAIYTPYKREKYVQNLLKRKGITCYLPVQIITRRYLRKIREVELPLFSRYVFVKIVKNDYIKVLETEQVLHFVRIGKNLLSIQEEEINLIKRILGESIPISASVISYEKGDRVEITSGNLTGIEGTLVHTNGKTNVLVDLHYMGYTLNIQIDRSLLKKKEFASI